MHQIQIDRRPRAQRKPIRLGIRLGKRAIIAHGRRLHIKRHEITAHGVEEIVVRHAHGLEVPEGVVEVGGEVGEGRHVHLVGVGGVDHRGRGVEEGEGVLLLLLLLRGVVVRVWMGVRVWGEVGEVLLRGVRVLLLLLLLLGEERGGVVASGDGGFDGVVRGHVDVVDLLLRLEAGLVEVLGLVVCSLQGGGFGVDGGRIWFGHGFRLVLASLFALLIGL